MEFSFSYFEIFRELSGFISFQFFFIFQDAEMTIFVPVDEIEQDEVLELFDKASNVSASPEDREKFANLLKG